MHIFKKVHVYVLRQSIHVDSNSYKLTSIYINNIVLFDNIRKRRYQSIISIQHITLSTKMVPLNHSCIVALFSPLYMVLLLQGLD